MSRSVGEKCTSAPSGLNDRRLGENRVRLLHCQRLCFLCADPRATTGSAEAGTRSCPPSAAAARRTRPSRRSSLKLHRYAPALLMYAFQPCSKANLSVARPAPQRPLQPNPERSVPPGGRRRSQRSPPPAGHLLSAQHHPHVPGTLLCTAAAAACTPHHPLDRLSLSLFQSDTPYRRSFTLLDNICHGRPGRASTGQEVQ